MNDTNNGEEMLDWTTDLENTYLNLICEIFI